MLQLHRREGQAQGPRQAQLQHCSPLFTELNPPEQLPNCLSPTCSLALNSSLTSPTASLTFSLGWLMAAAGLTHPGPCQATIPRPHSNPLRLRLSRLHQQQLQPPPVPAERPGLLPDAALSLTPTSNLPKAPAAPPRVQPFLPPTPLRGHRHLPAGFPQKPPAGLLAPPLPHPYCSPTRQQELQHRNQPTSLTLHRLPTRRGASVLTVAQGLASTCPLTKPSPPRPHCDHPSSSCLPGPGRFPPLSLCTCCSHCLECSSLKHPAATPHLLWVFALSSLVSSSRRPLRHCSPSPLPLEDALPECSCGYRCHLLLCVSSRRAGGCHPCALSYLVPSTATDQHGRLLNKE